MATRMGSVEIRVSRQSKLPLWVLFVVVFVVGVGMYVVGVGIKRYDT